MNTMRVAVDVCLSAGVTAKGTQSIVQETVVLRGGSHSGDRRRRDSMRQLRAGGRDRIDDSALRYRRAFKPEDRPSTVIVLPRLLHFQSGI